MQAILEGGDDAEIAAPPRLVQGTAVYGGASVADGNDIQFFSDHRCIVTRARPQHYNPSERTGMGTARHCGGAAGCRGCGRFSFDLAAVSRRWQSDDRRWAALL